MADTGRGDDLTSLELVKTGPEVLAQGELTLVELAAAASHEHDLAVDAAYSSLRHAIRAGKMLTTARDRMPRGEWEDWLATNCPGVMRMARAYIRIAFYEDALPKEITAATEALVYLRGLPATDGTGPRRHPPEVREEALRLVAAGISQRQTAVMLGVSRKSVREWVKVSEGTGKPNTKREGRRRAELIRRKMAEEALRRQEREQTIRRAVRKAGAATAEAWTMAERMQDVLAQAQRETEDRDARRALSEASVHYRKMRDEIVRALGVS